MLERVKKLYQLKRSADEAKKLLQAETLTIEERGVRVVLRADLQIKEIVLDNQRLERLERALNKAIREAQKKAAKKLSGLMGDLTGLGV